MKFRRATKIMKKEEIYYALPKSMSIASEGVITLPGRDFFIPLSPERILQSSLSANATNATSFRCGAFFLASSALSSNFSGETKSISLFKNEKISDISSFDSLLFASSLSILLPISKNKNSGATNSNNPTILFNMNTSNGLPLIYKEENTVFVSTTTSTNYHFFERSLFARATPTSSESPSTSFSVSLLFATIFFNRTISSNSSFIRLKKIVAKSKLTEKDVEGLSEE